MRAKRTQLYLLALALSSGTLAMTLANGWLDSRMSELNYARSRIPTYQPVEMSRIVVARRDIELGTELNPAMFEEIEWPSNALPEGAFESIQDVFESADMRIANAPLYRKEPLLMEKLSSQARRASLSGKLAPGLKAVSIKVNDVIGVGGFVLPGDFVDVLLIRTSREETETKTTETAYSFPVLQKVRVLGVDQSHDMEAESPRLARTVTLEVGMRDAQRVTLAASIGRLTLVLRNHLGREDDPPPELVDIKHLMADGLDKSNNFEAPVVDPTANQAPIATGPVVSRFANVTVVRSVDASEYTVTKSAARATLTALPAAE
ncbi:MAG: Flp pilus assembly protein CpaB [Pseudomonadota bacterium]